MAEHTAILGMQWGDEGKGKIVDMLAKEHDIVVRTAGGANAGHTVVVNDKKFVLHLIPSGIIGNSINVIGNGVVANLDRLAEEIEDLNKAGIEVTPASLHISEKAHIITPYHLLLDIAEEIAKSRKTGKNVGTTMQGIGPAYQLKAARTGLRMIDVTKSNASTLEKKISAIGEDIIARIQAMGVTPADIESEMNRNDQTKAMTRGLQKYFDSKSYVRLTDVAMQLFEHGENLQPFVEDTTSFLHSAVIDKKRIMFEGAQGTLLDIDHGTYPHVTSSNTTIGGIYTGSGIYVDIAHKLGILKAYTTRVGNGPFPTELTDELGKQIQTRGQEYGATTGRSRRVGWLDLVIAKYAICVNGINEIALTKLDVLDNLDEILVCKEYAGEDGWPITEFPANGDVLAKAKPTYTRLGGWKQDTSKARKLSDLPHEARKYVCFIEDMLDTKIKYVSTGPERDQIIECGHGE